MIQTLFSTYKDFLQEHPLIWSRFIFWLKSSAALVLAAFLAFEFETPEAGWAVICAAILIHPDSGAVLAKSIARIIGTFVGATVAILLFFMFPQAPWIFLLFLAIWVGACSYYSAYTRDFKTYAVALSGFMPAIIFMTAVEDSLSNYYQFTNEEAELIGSVKNQKKVTKDAKQLLKMGLQSDLKNLHYQQELLELQSNQVIATNARVYYLTMVYKSLGGNWLKPEDLSRNLTSN